MADNAMPQPRLRLWVPIVGGMLLLLVIGTIVALPTLIKLIPMPSLPGAGDQDAPAATGKLPDAFNKSMGTYGTPEPTPPAQVAAQPPVAQYVQRGTPPATSPPATQDAMLMAQQAAILDALQRLVQGAPQGQTPPAKEATQQAQPTQTTTPVPSHKKHWTYLAEGKEGGNGEGQKDAEHATGLTEEKKKSLVSAGKGLDIIKPSRWALPAKPLLTLYKSMELPGLLRRSIQSDIPGQAICELSDTVYDKFGYRTPILDRGSLVVVKQDGRLSYGATRVPIKVDQIELPTGEVVVATANVADAEGKNGLTGKVDAHITKLLLATAINAVISLGSNSLAGTPSGFNANPAQTAARETSASVSNDVRKLTDAQLRVPPTVTIAAKTPCLVQLDENITFSTNPVVVP
jgi:type IV secretory pathway VirB10-like protein